MYDTASKILDENKEVITNIVSEWVKTNHPQRTSDFKKCYRDVGHIVSALIMCLKDDSLEPIEYISRQFFVRGQFQLKSTHVEFQAYDVLLKEIKKIFTDVEIGATGVCSTAIETLKYNLSRTNINNNDNLPRDYDNETRIKHILYGWDDEKRIMQHMQQCQRNWDLSKTIPQDGIDYLLWIAQNAPTKQHEAYFDIHWSTDRETIEYLYQFSWGSTHRKNPPAMWRNSQMNANLYMIFVCKVPDTMYNCNNDGTLQDPFGESRWENAIVSVGMAMGLVMRAANKMGLRTGPNKVKDLGPDYNYEWEKKLGIYEDVKAGRKRLFYGLGIGIPNEGRPRWESDDPELALGASNGHHVTTKFEDPDFEPYTQNGQEKRKIKIVDIRDHAGESIMDPYGHIHMIPDSHEIKINTVYNRDIKIIKIGKND